MSRYTEQAETFLSFNRIVFECKFVKYGVHFIEDKEKRDIYDVLFSRPRNKGKLMLRFGQSIFHSGYRVYSPKKPKDCGDYYKDYEAALFALRSYGGGYKIRKPEVPTAYDVLACITKYSPGKFEDFCSDIGYDEASRQAERVYQAVLEEWLNVESFFSEEELEELREIK